MINLKDNFLVKNEYSKISKYMFVLIKYYV